MLRSWNSLPMVPYKRRNTKNRNRTMGRASPSGCQREIMRKNGNARRLKEKSSVRFLDVASAKKIQKIKGKIRRHIIKKRTNERAQPMDSSFISNYQAEPVDARPQLPADKKNNRNITAGSLWPERKNPRSLCCGPSFLSFSLNFMGRQGDLVSAVPRSQNQGYFL